MLDSEGDIADAEGKKTRKGRRDRNPSQLLDSEGDIADAEGKKTRKGRRDRNPSQLLVENCLVKLPEVLVDLHGRLLSHGGARL